MANLLTKNIEHNSLDIKKVLPERKICEKIAKQAWWGIMLDAVKVSDLVKVSDQLQDTDNNVVEHEESLCAVL